MAQLFPFGAAFVCQAGNFWAHPRSLFFAEASTVYCNDFQLASRVPYIPISFGAKYQW